MTVVMAVCADLARRDSEDLYAAGGPDGGDATVAVLTEAAGTCLELHTAGPAAVTEWLAARLGATGAWVALHARLAATPASPLPDRS